MSGVSPRLLSRPVNSTRRRPVDSHCLTNAHSPVDPEGLGVCVSRRGPVVFAQMFFPTAPQAVESVVVSTVHPAATCKSVLRFSH